MITTSTTFGEMRKISNLNKAIPYFIGNGEAALSDEKTLQEIEQKNPTWSANDMMNGINRLIEIANSGEEYLYSLYSEDEIAQESSKEKVKLFHFPAQRSKKFVIVLAGGGYGAVCSMAEAFPTAAKLNELGYSAFCLSYRTGIPDLMPKPMDDLAQAYQFIAEHADLFQIDPLDYAVSGFSAGGHLAASWGTKQLGFRNYHQPAPKCLFLGYPLIDMWNTLQGMPQQIREIMLQTYFGGLDVKEMVNPYNINENIDSLFPPSYLVHAMDDTTVPIWNSKVLSKGLSKNQIPNQLEKLTKGGHGFGLGNATESKGWINRAVAFWERLDSK